MWNLLFDLFVGRQVLVRLAERHPWHLWALPITLFGVMLSVCWVVETVARTVSEQLLSWVAPGPTGCKGKG